MVRVLVVGRRLKDVLLRWVRSQPTGNRMWIVAGCKSWIEGVRVKVQLLGESVLQRLQVSYWMKRHSVHTSNIKKQSILNIMIFVLLLVTLTSSQPNFSSARMLSWPAPNPFSKTILTQLNQFYSLLPNLTLYALSLSVPLSSVSPITLGLSPSSCQSTNNLTSLLPLSASDDLWVCFDPGFVATKCTAFWETKQLCGTYLEVHRPGNQTVQVRVPVPVQIGVGVNVNVPLGGLCAGTYHLWVVEATRVKKVITSLDMFYVYYPSCADN